MNQCRHLVTAIRIQIQQIEIKFKAKTGKYIQKYNKNKLNTHFTSDLASFVITLATVGNIPWSAYTRELVLPFYSITVIKKKKIYYLTLNRKGFHDKSNQS